MRAFAVSGYSGTGKTTLVEQIVKRLVKQGHVVVTAKSSMHEIHDTEGTDSWRHKRAGAAVTVILGPHSSAVTHNDRKSLRELLSGVTADFLIIEGLKEIEVPKLWCVGNAESEVGKLPESVKAVVTWSSNTFESDQRIPVVSSSEIEKIVELIRQEAVDLESLTV